ncbi:hypothetical protein ACM66B_001227 [Microbotryomycetes sp. NB124-2]
MRRTSSNVVATSIVATGLSLLLATGARAQTVLNQPPAIYQCMVAAFPYQCAETPCIVSFRPADDPTGLYYQVETSQSSGSISWTVNVREGGEVVGYITEASGLTPTTGRITVAAGRDGCELGGTVISTVGGGGNNQASETDATSSSAPETLSTSVSANGKRGNKCLCNAWD